MKTKSSVFPIQNTPFILILLFIFIVFAIFVVIFYFFPPMGVDWHFTFFKVAQNPFRPYEIKFFVNPPWTALILSPLSFLSENFGRAINASLGLTMMGILVIKRGGGRLALLLALTSFPVLTAIADGTVEWIPAIGFLLENQWGLPFLLAKPQSGLLAFLAWAKTKTQLMKLILPSIIIILLSLVIWGNWPLKIWGNVHAMRLANTGLSSWDIAPFPYAIPIGLFLIYLILKNKPRDSELLGILATICLVPYMAVGSLAVPFVLLSVSKRKFAILMWFILWVYAFVRNWAIFS